MKRYIRAAVNDLSNESEEFLAELALDPRTDSRTLRQLIDRTGPGDRAFYYALRNPNTPADILEEQSYSGNERTRENVAANPSTPADVLRRLAKDNAYYVKIGVQINPSTPVDVLQGLMNSDSFQDYQYILQNPSATEDMLRELIRRLPSELRHIARNPNAPVDILLQIARLKNNMFGAQARENLKARGYSVEEFE